MNVSEQIKALEDKRKALTEERTTIQTKAVDEGRTKDGAEQERFAEITAEVAAIDKELGDLKVMEKDLITSATPVKGTNDSEARASRAPAVVRSIKNDEPGIGFARFALSMFAAKGDVNSAKAFAENKFGHDARLQNVMKAAVAAGTTTSPTWAGNLVDYQNLSSEFIDFLRPRTIVGQFGVGGIPALRRVLSTAEFLESRRQVLQDGSVRAIESLSRLLAMWRQSSSGQRSLLSQWSPKNWNASVIRPSCS